MSEKNQDRTQGRRRKAAAGAAMSVAGMSVNMVQGQSSDRIRIGLIGCGGRGTGAVGDSMKADPAVTLMAVCDAFEFRAKGAAASLKKKHKDRCQVTDDHIFWGFDAYRKLAACDLDVVVMATPPVFRPYHLRACIDAGKSVFMEKPVCVDPAGARRVIEAADLATKKGLGITCGTQRRHSTSRKATLAEIHEGAIGELVGGQCYWNGGGIWYRTPNEGMTELEWQCHNWYHFTWLSGDQVCEPQIHNNDLVNWAFQGPPARFLGMGGRLTRGYQKQAAQAARMINGNEDKAELYRGDIFCHIGAELEYPNGARVMSMGRHAPKSSNRVGERIVGTKGTSNLSSTLWNIDGSEKWKFKGRGTSGRTEEHAILLRTIKDGKPVNEGRRIAESTLTAVGCRMSAFTGREFSWDWLLKTSKLDYLPPEKEKQLTPGPGIFHPVAVPGKTKLI